MIYNIGYWAAGSKFLERQDQVAKGLYSCTPYSKSVIGLIPYIIIFTTSTVFTADGYDRTNDLMTLVLGG